MSDHTSLDKAKIKFLLLEGVHASAVEALERAGYTNVDYRPGALVDEELKQALQDAHFVGIRSRTQLTAEVLASAQKLIGIGCFCIGTNQVDLDAALGQGIAVFNAPYSNTRSVAELMIGEAILLLRKIPQKNAGCHRGEWQKSAEGAFEIRGKTMGLVGYGAIGSQLSVLAESLGMHVTFFDTVSKLPMGNATPCDSMEQLLGGADIVSLHVPDLPSTRNLIGAAEIAQMKPGAILLNASRGKVVQIDALAAALQSGHLAGAAIDVFPEEPKSNKDEFKSALRGLDQVLLTPHVGGSTMEAQQNIGLEVAEKLIRYSDTGATLGAVNFPEVALPTQHDAHRLLHIHENVPGVMRAINEIFSNQHINIVGQYLQTRGGVGYVVIDVNSEYSDKALNELRNIPGTVRCRVLF